MILYMITHQENELITNLDLMMITQSNIDKFHLYQHNLFLIHRNKGMSMIELPQS